MSGNSKAAGAREANLAGAELFDGRTMFGLHGMRALITGARRGIGLAIAQALAAAGADVVATSASLEGSDSEVEAKVRQYGRQFTAIPADLSSRDSVDDLVSRVLQQGPVDILVNNGGTIARRPALDHPDEMWDQVLEVNLTSQFRLSRALAGPMIERRFGRIIFIASLLSFQGGITVPGYAASKSGIAGLTKALANEWSAHGVTVNAIAPGYIATDNTEALRADPERSRAILDRIPAGRWGRAHDIAPAAVFLASHASGYLSGAVIPVDGGWLGR